MILKFLGIGTRLKILFLITFFIFPAFSLSAEEAKREVWQIWETKIEPTAKVFPNLESVYLILTVENVGKETRELALPYKEGQPWFQWIEIYHKEKRLPAKPDHDYVYPPSSVEPGKSLSLLVPLEAFYEMPAKSKKGKYELIWQGTTIGGAQTVRAEFEINPKMKSPVDILSLGTYLKSGETKEELWKRILASPSDAKWITLFRVLPAEYIDPLALIQLVKASDDVGIRREALRALGRAEKNSEAEKNVIEFLQSQKDKPLIEFALLSLGQLRDHQ